MSQCPSPALTEALDLLGRRDHFRAELVAKLEARGHNADDVKAAVAACVDQGWIDDSFLAERFVRWRAVANGWGPHRLRQELHRRGVEDTVIAGAVAMDPGLTRDALDTALRRVRRRAKPGWWGSREGRLRMISSLLRRGFDADDARRAVEDLATEIETQDDGG